MIITLGTDVGSLCAYGVIRSCRRSGSNSTLYLFITILLSYGLSAATVSAVSPWMFSAPGMLAALPDLPLAPGGTLTSARCSLTGSVRLAPTPSRPARRLLPSWSSWLVWPEPGWPRPWWTSALVAPIRVSDAEAPERWLGAFSGWTCGWKVFSAGAVPAGKVWAWNSGTASLPTLTPGACWRCQYGCAGRNGPVDLRPWW
jgi:hypothetical protein